MERKPITVDQVRRTREALAGTHKLLAKELGYLPCNRDEKQIAFYRAHIEKLENMLGYNNGRGL